MSLFLIHTNTYKYIQIHTRRHDEEKNEVNKQILHYQAQGAHLSIGELIRQMRRQRNITQTELGETRFSKSYVSAVERNKVTPSQEALLFFAEQLNEPVDYFTSLSAQAGNERQLPVFSEQGPLNTQGYAQQDETMALLDIVLESSDLHTFPAHFELPVLSAEVVATLPISKQARYYFLVGLVAKEKQNLSAALQAFEYALTLSPPQQQAAVLNELGVYYYQMQAPQTALGYYLRALWVLQDEAFNSTTINLLFQTELHCGDVYYALGDFKQACTHYERARLQLRSEYDMHTAGLLYRDLGFCTYAAIYQRTALSLPADQRATPEEMEQEFQRAVGFLLQSRILYQVSSNKAEETRSRLTQALVLLDFSICRRQLALQHANGSKEITITNCTSLLDEAEEQCKQVLMSWQNLPADASSVPVHLNIDLYIALAYLTRVYVQRASLARLNRYSDTSTYERAVAANLCQSMLDTFTEHELPLRTMRTALNMKARKQDLHAISLPRLPRQPTQLESVPRSSMSQVEVYFAVGELAEEFAHATPEREYAQYCYAQANQCFQRGLALARSLAADRQPEPHYLLRCYQHFVCLLEERNLTAPDFAGDTTHTLLNTLAEAFHHFQSPALLLNSLAS